MNGREQKHLLHHWRNKHIKTWYLLLVFIALLTSSLLFMRQNNLKMIELRNLVIQADENNSDVAGSLKRLNDHVFHHINTEIVRPIELVHSYNRQAQAAIEAANRGSGRDIYAEATAACERRGIPITSIAQCAAEYALKNNPGVGPTKINLPDKNLFKYTFASPLWVPDAAGICLLFTGVVGIWLLLRLIEYIAVHMIIKSRLKNNFI